MPGASTPTFAYKEQLIGMGLRARYRVPYRHQDTPIANNNIDSIYDPKRHGACCCVSYVTILDEEVNPNNEQELCALYPRFNNRIHHLIEQRREHIHQNQQQQGKCTIL